LEKKPCTPVLLHVLHVRQDDTVPIVLHVIMASTVLETTATVLCVMAALQDGIKTQWGKEVVCRVFLDCTKIVSQRKIANNAAKEHFQM
jgi:hypothetical protein